MAANFGHSVAVPPGWLTARHKELPAAFKRMAPHARLTVSERQILSRAVLMTARAELAALDPTTDPVVVVRLDGAAARARREWGRVVAIDRKPATPSLQELMAGAR